MKKFTLIALIAIAMVSCSNESKTKCFRAKFLNGCDKGNVLIIKADTLHTISDTLKVDLDNNESLEYFNTHSVVIVK